MFCLCYMSHQIKFPSQNGWFDKTGCSVLYKVIAQTHKTIVSFVVMSLQLVISNFLIIIVIFINYFTQCHSLFQKIGNIVIVYEI